MTERVIEMERLVYIVYVFEKYRPIIRGCLVEPGEYGVDDRVLEVVILKAITKEISACELVPFVSMKTLSIP